MAIYYLSGSDFANSHELIGILYRQRRPAHRHHMHRPLRLHASKRLNLLPRQSIMARLPLRDILHEIKRSIYIQFFISQWFNYPPYYKSYFSLVRTYVLLDSYNI
jgi:hypothetical protein